MIVVDSSVWIDYFTGKDTPGADRLDTLLAEDLVAIGDLMLTEVLQGFRADKDYRKAKKLLLSLAVLPVFAIICDRSSRDLDSGYARVCDLVYSGCATRQW